jgi:hypothetical protein
MRPDKGPRKIHNIYCDDCKAEKVGSVGLPPDALETHIKKATSGYLCTPCAQKRPSTIGMMTDSVGSLVKKYMAERGGTLTAKDYAELASILAGIQ